MNEIVNKYLLAGETLTHEIHVRRPGFMYSTCGPYKKTRKEYKNLKKPEIHDIFIKTN